MSFSGDQSRDNRKTVAGICILLAAITWAVFGQTLSYGFVEYDDNDYVYANEVVTRGVSGHGLVFALTRTVSANWHPLTTISHMIDCQLFSLHAGGHHFTNVLLHTIATILLFL